jgi:predicted nucleotide-binding protein (sugar kinase/HSP70/actin superfamily)
MSKILIGIIAVMSLITIFLYNQNKTLTANNLALEGAVATQEEAIQSLQNDFQLQTTSLLELQNRNQEIQKEMSRYLDIFKRHNLSKLAAAKPGLIEPRVNKGTKDVFDSIEEDSRNIDSLDDGLQLQSATN